MSDSKRKKVNPKRFAETLIRGGTVQEAILRGGYSPTSAKRGWASASKACMAEYARMLDVLLEELVNIIKLTQDQRKKIILGKLFRRIEG